MQEPLLFVINSISLLFPPCPNAITFYQRSYVGFNMPLDFTSLLFPPMTGAASSPVVDAIQGEPVSPGGAAAADRRGGHVRGEGTTAGRTAGA